MRDDEWSAPVSSSSSSSIYTLVRVVRLLRSSAHFDRERFRFREREFISVCRADPSVPDDFSAIRSFDCFVRSTAAKSVMMFLMTLYKCRLISYLGTMAYTMTPRYVYYIKM